MFFKGINEFLRKFENIRAGSSVMEKETLEWCLKKTGMSPDDIEVKIKRPNIIISTKNMTAKTVIFTSQNSLFREMEKRFGDKAPRRILFK